MMKGRLLPMWKDICRAPLWTLILFPFAVIGLRLLIGRLPLIDTLSSLAANATGGLIGYNLVANIDNYVLILGLLILGFGRLRLRDLGLRWGKLAAGVATLVGVWLLLQIAMALIDGATGSALSLHPNWTQYPTFVVLGWLIGNLFGTAVFEELAYRGFLLPQIYLHLPATRRRLPIAILISLVIFTLMHIPQWIEYGLLSPMQPLFVLALGLIFTAIYILTNNIFVAIAFHALHDAPTPLFASPADAHWLMFGLELCFIGACLLWRWLSARGQGRLEMR
jgi:membrane protease YdiL (CAAX protease family)